MPYPFLSTLGFVAMKKFSAAFFAVAAAAALQIALATAAEANICREVGSGRSYNADECPAGSIAVGEAWDEVAQRAAGLPPCYTADGVPYYTPGDAPC